jgi:hypothetical protein
MLLNWRERRPRLDGEFVRAFPTRGKRQPWPKPRQDDGGPLLYSNYRVHLEAVPKTSGATRVTPHSGHDHSYISTLQAAGIEAGLVAKPAGHVNPVTTLGVYSHAVRGGDAAAAVFP